MRMGEEEPLEEWTDEELIEELKGLYDAIYNVECYSSTDYMNFLAIAAELGRRGYRIVKSIEVVRVDDIEDSD